MKSNLVDMDEYTPGLMISLLEPCDVMPTKYHRWSV